MSRRVTGSGKVRKKRRMAILWRMFLFFSVVILIVLGFIYLLNSNRLSIQKVEVSGSNEYLDNDVKEYVSLVLSGNYFGIFSKENIFLYPKREIYTSILERFPTIKDVSFELDPFESQILYISLTERRENALWCKNTEDCYFMDRTGYIFDKAPTYSPGIVFFYLGGIEGNPIGRQFLSEEDLTRINSFIQAIKNHPDLASLLPVGVEVISPDLSVLLSGGGKIVIGDVSRLSDAFDNLLLSVLERGLEVENLEYIDLRIENKVFFKHKVY
ncbi:MAG: hypothetical protein MRY49_02935 [Candidatus Pacebacteria bacterium]|nr:hypothetical protein [Candidatus Paceibacterota bacterium]